MVYVHEKPFDEGLVRHWANEIGNEEDEGYEEATYLILQVETGIKYGDAVDVVPCRYTYLATDEPIEEPEPEPEETQE